MRRFWLLLGVALGGLMVWSLTHEARRHFARAQRASAELAKTNRHSQLELAELSALLGEDLLSDAWWEKELAQYKNTAPDDDWLHKEEPS